eukprot:5097000-Heterocapsa_arctica.AAC.1
MLGRRRSLAGVHVQVGCPRVPSCNESLYLSNAPHHPNLGSFDCREVPRCRRCADVDDRRRDGRMHYAMRQHGQIAYRYARVADLQRER